MRVCSLRHLACNTNAPYCYLWAAQLCSIFPHYLINGTIFVKKFLSTKCVFWFPLKFLLEPFLILRRTERDMIKMYGGLHLKYPLFLCDFNKNWIFSTDFQKILKCQISRKSIQGEQSCSMWAGGRQNKAKSLLAILWTRLKRVALYIPCNMIF